MLDAWWLWFEIQYKGGIEGCLLVREKAAKKAKDTVFLTTWKRNIILIEVEINCQQQDEVQMCSDSSPAPPFC